MDASSCLKGLLFYFEELPAEGSEVAKFYEQALP